MLANLALATPADAAAASCSHVAIVAAMATPHPLGLQYDFIDAATATATCVDVSGASHTSQLVMEWYDDTGTGWAAMPGCPSQIVAPPVSWTGAVTLTGTGACHRPPSSGAFGRRRIVCVDLVVDGASYWARRRPVTSTATRWR